MAADTKNMMFYFLCKKSIFTQIEPDLFTACDCGEKSRPEPETNNSARDYVGLPGPFVYTYGYRVFPGVKTGRDVTLTPHPF
jgi:hypothetical protein